MADDTIDLDRHRRARATLAVFAEILGRWDTRIAGDLREAVDETFAAKGIPMDWEAGDWARIDASIEGATSIVAAELARLRAALEAAERMRTAIALIPHPSDECVAAAVAYDAARARVKP